MSNIVCINKLNEKNLTKGTVEQETISNKGGDLETPCTRAVVPTIDVYSARVLFNITQKMVEDTVDRRITLLEKRIGERDREIMLTIRKIQARMVMRENKVKLPWWRRLFSRVK